MGSRRAVFSDGRGPTTIGILLVITAVAFEGMGVGTAMPAVMADIGSLETYAWPFVAFLASNVLATVFGGRLADRYGPTGALVAGVATFAVGLVVAGTAGTLEQLLLGRVLQGLGAGALTVAIFVLVALVYPVGLRPAVFGWTATAWVLPSLLGPPAAAWITQTWSWHWVFLGIAPIAVIALVMMSRALRGASGRRPASLPAVRGGRWLLIAAPGAAIGVAVLSWAGERPGVAVLPVVGAALVVLVPSVMALVPRGTLWAARGVPTAVLARGLLAGGFFAMNAFVPLMLTRLHDWSLQGAGAVLIAGSLGWSAASTWQGGRPSLPRHRLLTVGFVMVGSAVLLTVPVTLGWFPPLLMVLVQAIGGLGMGLGMPALSLLVMGHSREGEIGFNTAAAQILDGLTTALLIAVGGALTAMVGLRDGFTLLLATLVVATITGAVLAPRSRLVSAPASAHHTGAVTDAA